MAKTMLICGYGTGISAAIAEKFGQNGFSIGLVARSEDRLRAGVESLQALGITAVAFPADLTDPASIATLIVDARAKLGGITVLQWNAHSIVGGDLLATDPATIRAVFDLPVVSLLTAVQAALPELRAQEGAALLVTNGALGLFNSTLDVMAVQRNTMGLAVANSAKHKLVALLAEKLKSEGVYVGEVMVMGLVKGTRSDTGHATIPPSRVADQFWDLYTNRSEVTAAVK